MTQNIIKLSSLVFKLQAVFSQGERQGQISQKCNNFYLSLQTSDEIDDLLETYKLLTHIYDNRNGLPLLQLDLNDRTRGNDMKPVKYHVRYDMRKYFFTCRIINLWNSLPAHVIHASTVNYFKNKLDAYWSTQEMIITTAQKFQEPETEVLQCKLQNFTHIRLLS